MNIGKIANKNSHLITTDDIEIKPKNTLDNYTKLSILATLAAYKKTDYIYVDDKFDRKIDLRFLSNFMSYVVNHPNAPKEFKFRIEQNSDEKLKASVKQDTSYDVILSFSGGIDSTAGLLYCLDNGLSVLPLWVDFGQKNKEAEKEASISVLKKLHKKSLEVSIDLEKQILNGWKDWDFIVPARNFIFAAISNSIFKYSNNTKGVIFLCAVKEEMKKWKNRDKSKYFFNISSQLFSKDSGKNIKLCSPFEKYSKAEVLYWWKHHWEKKYGISPHNTSTCYYDSAGACGKCRACFRRAVALLAAGYEVDDNFQVHPLTDTINFIKDIWLPEIAAGKISRTGRLDFYIAMEKCKDILPPHLLKHYDNLSWQTLKAISRRKMEISNVKLK